MSYSQNNEEEIILEYFGDFVGHLVDIGCNDGKTLSNSARLIELGWTAKLFEPDKGPFEVAKKYYEGNEKVYVRNCAVGDKVGKVPFYSSQDTLVSSCVELNKKVWSKYRWIDTTCEMIIYNNNWEADFITIDAEFMDWDILQTIDLTNVKCLCIETGKHGDDMIKYCSEFNMNLIAQTSENLIFVK